MSPSRFGVDGKQRIDAGFYTYVAPPLQTRGSQRYDRLRHREEGLSRVGIFKSCSHKSIEDKAVVASSNAMTAFVDSLYVHSFAFRFPFSVCRLSGLRGLNLWFIHPT